MDAEQSPLRSDKNGILPIKRLGIFPHQKCEQRESFKEDINDYEIDTTKKKLLTFLR